MKNSRSAVLLDKRGNTNTFVHFIQKIFQVYFKKCNLDSRWIEGRQDLLTFGKMIFHRQKFKYFLKETKGTLNFCQVINVQTPSVLTKMLVSRTIFKALIKVSDEQSVKAHVSYSVRNCISFRHTSWEQSEEHSCWWFLKDIYLLKNPLSLE